MLACAAAGAAWIGAGQAWTRKHIIGPAPIAASARTESNFIALLFPRVTPRALKYAMSVAELSDLLGELRKKGYVSIGVEDVREFYAGKRLLPPKAVLLGFSSEAPSSVRLADRVLKRRRMRGVVFITRAARGRGTDRKQYLTSRALAQLRRGGAWEFGWRGLAPAPGEAGEAGSIAVALDEDPEARGLATTAVPLRFAASDLGLNHAGTNPGRLNILAMRSDRLRDVTLRVIESSWPRNRGISDDFMGGTLDPDWIPEWGVVKSGAGRLRLLPLPRQTGAGVFLRGSDQWRDIVLEFDLRRHRREFWVYARYREGESWVRFGTRDGFWLVEQKIGPRNLPTLLGRAPSIENGRPASVRLVLKDGTAIVHVNGRMQFGRPLRMHPNVARGRVWLGVYDAGSRSALGVVSRFRAEPVKEAWIAFEEGAAKAGFNEGRLDSLREAAVSSRAISPRWLSIRRDGTVASARTQETLIRSLAGFYGCRLVPMAVFPSAGASLLSDPAAASRLLGALESAARSLDAPGVNLRMRGTELARPEMTGFLTKLGTNLRAGGRRLWVTVDGPEGAAAPPSVDGLLRPSVARDAGFELLEAAAAPPVKASFKELATK